MDRKGLPEVQPEKPAVTRKGDPFQAAFDIVQKGEPYTLEVPAVISFATGSRKETLKLDAATGRLSRCSFDEEPRSIDARRGL